MEPDNSNLQKLEQDLQNLTQEKTSQAPPVQTPINIAPSLTSEPPIPDQEPVQPPTEAPKSGSPIITVAVVLGAIAILAVVAYAIGTIYTNKAVVQKACTAEAKVCPDGSSVGRSGPNCDFDPCPVASPTLTPVETKPEGYRGYNPNGPTFDLTFPSECTNLVCTTKDFSLTINPTAGGHGTTVTPVISKIKLGIYEWERRFFNEFSTYDLEYNGDTYLIEVDYNPYSQSAQDYFEKILSTFKFMVATPSATPTATP